MLILVNWCSINNLTINQNMPPYEKEWDSRKSTLNELTNNTMKTDSSISKDIKHMAK